MSQLDTGPQDELSPGALAYALRRAVARRAVLGDRRVPRLEPQSPPSPRPPSTGAPREAPAAHVPHSETHRIPPPPQGAPERAPGRAAAPLRRDPPGAAPAPEPATGGGSERPSTIAAKVTTLEELRQCVASCRSCALAESRTNTVFADGLGTRRILFVGEAPGADEDRTGTPFVGRAGQLLTDIITKGMKLQREDVYIANVLKCRPPGNRDPLPSETELCTGWLDRQIELVDPLVIIPLGRHAACHVLGVDAPLGRLRGRVHEHNGRKVVPTYHPAYLLRAPQEKKKTWEDIQLAMGEAGL